MWEGFFVTVAIRIFPKTLVREHTLQTVMQKVREEKMSGACVQVCECASVREREREGGGNSKCEQRKLNQVQHLLGNEKWPADIHASGLQKNKKMREVYFVFLCVCVCVCVCVCIERKERVVDKVSVDG